jgi:hypothetical protein
MQFLLNTPMISCVGTKVFQDVRWLLIESNYLGIQCFIQIRSKENIFLIFSLLHLALLLHENFHVYNNTMRFLNSPAFRYSEKERGDYHLRISSHTDFYFIYMPKIFNTFFSICF